MKFNYEIKSPMGIVYSLDAVIVEMKDGSEYSFNALSNDIDFDTENNQVTVKGDFILNWANIYFPNGNNKYIERDKTLTLEQLVIAGQEIWKDLHKDPDQILSHRLVLNPEEFLSENKYLNSDEFHCSVLIDSATKGDIPCRVAIKERNQVIEYEFKATVDDDTWTWEGGEKE